MALQMHLAVQTARVTCRRHRLFSNACRFSRPLRRPHSAAHHCLVRRPGRGRGPCCHSARPALGRRGGAVGPGRGHGQPQVFQISTVRYSNADGHIARKPYAGSVAARLGAITSSPSPCFIFVRPMGFGMVGGLVAFQVLLMANALGALWRYQRLQLAGTSPPTRSGPDAGAEAQSRAGPGRRFYPPGPGRRPSPCLAVGLLAGTPIPVGDHVTATVGGLTFDLDTIWGTLIACAAVIGLGFY